MLFSARSLAVVGAVVSTAAAASCGDTINYTNATNFGPNGGCITSPSYQSYDQGQISSRSSLQDACRNYCTQAGASCVQYVAQIQSTPNGLSTGQCFLYSSSEKPSKPAPCANSPSQIFSEFKDTSYACLSSSAGAASTFCSSYLSIGTVTKTSTATSFTTISPGMPTATVTATLTTTVDSRTVCSVTVSGGGAAVSTFYYQSRDTTQSNNYKRTVRAKAAVYPTPSCLSSSPAKSISSACNCFLTSKTATTSVTSTSTSVISLATPAATTVTVTAHAQTTLTGCSSTSTVTLAAAPMSCGIHSVPTTTTSGTISCTQPAASPSLNSFFRIEGLQSGEGTIFEGCIIAGPRVVTTPSGGSHECDGTNGQANPNPGTTPTDMIDAAAALNGFGYDGTYDTQFNDYFITSIAETTQGNDEFWGILDNGQFTPTGGCGYEATPASHVLWAFNAFNVNYFLQISPQYAVLKAGSTIQLTVTDEMTGNAASGATINAGATSYTSDSNGHVTLSVPAVPGCYQYKAVKSNALVSNAFYLSVIS